MRVVLGCLFSYAAADAPVTGKHQDGHDSNKADDGGHGDFLLYPSDEPARLAFLIPIEPTRSKDRQCQPFGKPR
jgi:hypothetical protein